MYLFFDTETADKPRNWKAPAADLANWPRLVQLAWISCDDSGAPSATREYLIRPDGFTIKKGAAAVHGITTAIAQKDGVELGPVLTEFAAAIETAQVVVAHNIAFDQPVVTAEFIRASMDTALDRKTCRCTMKESTDYCKLPGPYGNKWPTLTELHQVMFGEAFGETHSALADAEACLRCFFQLQKVGVIL